ncbi:MAG: YlmC/YmxH family sporulation protein [Desulfotomaculaceae bacterium]|nr:YlmC/YmxH family sporulation protein [Desulfotomaculaceae bacterium]MDD4767007.1 YlmC/YmxH family sporulation protein [Desulfotomaculaceae bacterium]
MLFKISDLGLRDIVNLVDGAKLGPVSDVYIDLETGKVISLVLSGGRKYFGLLAAGSDVVVPWEKIKKIGVDTVLVEVEEQAKALYLK